MARECGQDSIQDQTEPLQRLFMKHLCCHEDEQKTQQNHEGIHNSSLIVQPE